jgi:hypothetical protein
VAVLELGPLIKVLAALMVRATLAVAVAVLVLLA